MSGKRSVPYSKPLKSPDPNKSIKLLWNPNYGYTVSKAADIFLTDTSISPTSALRVLCRGVRRFTADAVTLAETSQWLRVSHLLEGARRLYYMLVAAAGRLVGDGNECFGSITQLCPFARTRVPTRLFLLREEQSVSQRAQRLKRVHTWLR